MLDTAGVGSIGREQISEISRNTEIQDLLKFTVFWMPLKRREWSFFYAIFEDDSDNITVQEWMSAAHGLSMSEVIAIKYIRLDEEHRNIADSSAVMTPGESWSTAR